MLALYRYADLIIGNSKKLSKDLSIFLNRPVITIYNPAKDLDIIKLAKKNIKFEKKKNVILNVGRLELQKDQITILKAIKDLNVFLILIGYGSLENKLRNFINMNKMNHKVLILNKVTNPYPYFRKSNLFVLSSLYEGFPNVLVESITLNLPIISSNCNSGPSEILMNRSGNNLFKCKDHIELNKKIKKYFKNNKILKKNNKKLFTGLSRFDKKKILRKYDEVFSKLFNYIN